MQRARWATLGFSIAVALAVAVGAGGLRLAEAGLDSGERPVTVTVAPERILDTRANLGLTGRFLSESPRDLQVTGAVPIASGGTQTVVPTGAVAVLLNVTVVRPGGNGFLSLRPGGATGTPSTSTVNFTTGSIEPNAATVDLGPDGDIQIFLLTDTPNGVADVLIDVTGYTIDHGHDDRYLTEEEIDEKIAEIPTGSTGPEGPQGPPGPAGSPGDPGPAFIPGYEVVQGSSNSLPASPITLEAECPAGKVALGGGGSREFSDDYAIGESFPKADGSGWEIEYVPLDGAAGALGRAWVICATAEP